MIPHFSSKNTKIFLLSFAHKLGLGSVLAFVAGLVNSVGFLGFGQFVSHVSGHATFAAVQYSEQYYTLALTSFSALFFFITGAAFTAILLKGKTVEDIDTTYAWPLFIEAILLFYVVLGSFYYNDMLLTKDSYGHANYFLILSFAMGMQNATLRKEQGSHIRTTHMTGTATDIGVAIGSAFVGGVLEICQRIKISKKKKEISHTSEILVDSVKVFYIKSRVERLFLHVTTLFSFGVGAIVGTFGFLRYHFFILTIPMFLLFVITVFEIRSRNIKRKLRENDKSK
ncbi:YoaK family protein [Fluviispira multicolorata]|uniref:DUF1275 domain-containing protein n=1 Tax=Fluviispira multicolorata TaxID=2654512 RepID=A0A833JH14_9BACT|nr:YoaK family protein [Fluviispira multicolorata]KAB8033152.1 DUF1275 domain-containing protein [Fluviispira multicolorata]